MEDRNLDKALEIMSGLITGEEINRNKGNCIPLYEEYSSNAEVYDILHKILKKLNLNIYEYNYGLYLSAGENNHVFGFSRADLKKALGIRLNRELYLCYFIIYQIITRFYSDSAGYTYVEYVKIDEIIRAVDENLKHIIKDLELMVANEVEENSFRTLAIMWEDMPISTSEEAMRAARNSKYGYVKIVFNFLVAQELLIESEERYYPKERMKALIENYFQEFKGRLYQIMTGKGEVEDATY